LGLGGFGAGGVLAIHGFGGKINVAFLQNRMKFLENLVLRQQSKPELLAVVLKAAKIDVDLNQIF